MKYIRYFEGIEIPFRNIDAREFDKYQSTHKNSDFSKIEKLVIKNFLSGTNSSEVRISYNSKDELYVYIEYESYFLNIFVEKFEDDWFLARLVYKSAYSYYICDGYDGLVKCINHKIMV